MSEELWREGNGVKEKKERYKQATYMVVFPYSILGYKTVSLLGKLTSYTCTQRYTLQFDIDRYLGVATEWALRRIRRHT